MLKDSYKNPRTLWDEVLRPATPAINGISTRRLLEKANRCVRFPVATDSAEELTTLYQEGSTAFGQPEGTRLPTPSGKLEFWTDVLEKSFATMGLSALPEFYSEKEQLITLPHVEPSASTEKLVVSPFFTDKNYARTGVIVHKSDDENTNPMMRTVKGTAENTIPSS